MNDLGRRVFGLAAICIGAIGLWFGQLAGVWQPMPDFAEHWEAFPYLIAAAFVIGGLAIQWRRSEMPGGYLLAALFAFFALMWAKRIVLLPLVFGTWGGGAEQLAMALAGLLIALHASWPGNWRKRPALEVSRILFGACAIAFGINHFLNLDATSAMVPEWIPPTKLFWAIATGIADVAAGLAIVSGIVAPLAARFLTVMFASFLLFVWLPTLFGHPADHVAWAGTAITFALVGAAWVMADALAVRVRGEGS